MDMLARIQKWGHSLAVRIPKAFAAEAGLEENAPVEVTLEEGRLVITPVVAPQHTLEALLAGITRENLHTEVETGPAAGREAW
jgi:antitoxin MazE